MTINTASRRRLLTDRKAGAVLEWAALAAVASFTVSQGMMLVSYQLQPVFARINDALAVIIS